MFPVFSLISLFLSFRKRKILVYKINVRNSNMFMLKYKMKYSIYKCCSFIRLFYDTYSI